MLFRSLDARRDDRHAGRVHVVERRAEGERDRSLDVGEGDQLRLLRGDGDQDELLPPAQAGGAPRGDLGAGRGRDRLGDEGADDQQVLEEDLGRVRVDLVGGRLVRDLGGVRGR